MSIKFAHPSFFPHHIPDADWQEFTTGSYGQSVTGIVYHGEPRLFCGTPVGGLDTGCLDIEPNSMLESVTIFNDLVVPHGLFNICSWDTGRTEPPTCW